jgi:two-component system phosphate regulon sensor histidine kinase PhoR
VVVVFFAYALFVILRQKRLSEIQKDFINNMTHEFKTPIATISVSTEVLKDPKIIHDPERLRSYATIIEKENTRLKQQVERVLQMARLDKEDIGFKKDRVDVHELISDAVQNAALTLQEKGGRISVALNATRPHVAADRLHLTNALNNLLDNAIKYCATAPEISITTSDERGGILIAVTDNGIGIWADNHKRVFQKFYRVPTGNVHNVKGFGLGLNYVKTVVEAHRGKVILKSEIDIGSTFSIWLPIDAR